MLHLLRLSTNQPNLRYLHMMGSAAETDQVLKMEAKDDRKGKCLGNMTLQDALFICYKQSPDNAHSVTFSQRSSSPRLIEDETFNDSDIMNNLIDYEDGQEEPDSLRVDKNM
ncbi:uncharacterized protein TNCV_5057601 [Trichonephila clavipes]|nr:uncharacterized protein TNCV_5057601 [Trichonephila clavipes]